MLYRFNKENWTNRDLGVARILFFFLMLISFSADQLTRHSNYALSTTCLEQSGVWLEIWLSPSLASSIVKIFYVSVFFSMIGLLTRVSMLFAFLSLLALLLNSWKFCFFNHSHLPVLLPVLLWTLLDDSSSFRLDSLILKKTRPRTEPGSWLPFCVQAYFCIIFFLTGIAKLRSGFEWFTADSLRHMLIVQNFAHFQLWAHPSFMQVNFFLVSQPWLCRVLAVFAFVAEITAPLALFYPRLRKWIVFDLALLQVGIFVAMYINFAPWSTLYVFWLPVTRIHGFIESQLKRFGAFKDAS